MRPTDPDLQQIPDELLHRRPDRAGEGLRAKRLLAWLEDRSWHPTGLQLERERIRRQQSGRPAA